MLTRCSETITSLDCLLAFAECAAKHKYIRPQMTEDNVLHIIGGRHPICELFVDNFIENDIRCQGQELSDEASGTYTEKDSVEANLILLTGANYSGKSVYLRQAALIVFMAHIGSYVPAQSATIGLTDKILTRLQTRETVAKAQSAFLIDVQQVSLALQLMTPRSLLVIDEFGKGTESTDGAALFGALVEHLIDPTKIRPRTLMATHFHEILHPRYLKISSQIAFKHMQISVTKRATFVEEAMEGYDEVAYYYRLADGPSRASFGINCAAMGGVPDRVIARAEQLRDIQARGESLVDALSVPSEADRRKLRVAERIAKKFVAWDIQREPDENLRGRLREILS